MKLNNSQFLEVAKQFGFKYAALKMFWEVESSGICFGADGRIIIQFEPLWFKRLFVDWHKSAPGSLWIVNKVETQSKEWLAFNSAAGIDKESAMEATSIGGPQIMGLHWKRLGFSSVQEMWEFCKESEKNQLICMVKFIMTDKRLLAAVKNLNFHLIATYYNGSGYKDFAIENGTVPYDVKLKKAYYKHSA